MQAEISPPHGVVLASKLITPSTAAVRAGNVFHLGLEETLKENAVKMNLLPDVIIFLIFRLYPRVDKLLIIRT